MRNSVTAAEVVELLNGALEADKQAVAALVNNRVPCSETLAEHPTIQCGSAAGQSTVGMLGVLNGLFGVDEKGYGAIAAVFEDSGELTRFVLLGAWARGEVD